MKRFNMVVLLAFVSGCNGEEFTTFSQSSLDAPDAAPGSGGGASTGGAPSASTGGALSATGGAPEVDARSSGGGSHNTGGSGVAVVDAGCTLVTHDNGLGQTWQDCVPLGTHDEEQAMKACHAWCEENGCTCAVGKSAACSDYLDRVHAAAGDGVSFMGWPWQGPNEGVVQKANSSVNPYTCETIGAWN